MSRRKPRGLSPEERELWSRVIDKATPQQGPQSLFVEPSKTAPMLATPVPIPMFKVGAKARPTQTAMPKAVPIAMDKKAFAKLKRGKITPDVKLDLHGMTQDQAHPALINTILNAHAAGKRLVLVVTGKGKHKDDGGPIPVRTGVLRHAVPQWLGQAPLKQVVLQTSPASQSHGGSGALYVYLRRIR